MRASRGLTALAAVLLLAGLGAQVSLAGHGALILQPFAPEDHSYNTCKAALLGTPHTSECTYWVPLSADSLSPGDYVVRAIAGNDTVDYHVSVRPGTLTHVVGEFPTGGRLVNFICRNSVRTWIEERYKEPSIHPLDDLPFERRAATYVQVAPVYPDSARVAGVQGVVHLEVSLTSHGTLQSVRVVDGVSGLTRAALDAVRQWVFRPAELYGERVPARLRFPIRFTLRGRSGPSN